MGAIKRSFTKQITLFAIFFTIQSFATTTITVCDQNCDFSNLNSAIENANAGDLVEVSSSQIINDQIVIKKSIRLIGKNWPTLNGMGKSKMLLILAPNVEVAGLVIKNSEVSYLNDISAIRIQAENVFVHDNKLINNAYGIYLARAKNCRIENNEVVGIGRGDAESGNGIHIWNGKGHHILGNKLTKNRDGIYFEFVSDSKIENNLSHQNSRYGLHFMFSNRNEYRGNRFSKNSAGVAVMYSKSILMENNEFSESLGGGAYGLLLKDISLSKIIKNKFLNNSVGVYIEGTSRSHFENNLLKNNTRAVRVFGNSEGNTFQDNSFVQNTFEVSTNSSVSLNIFAQNYWGQYSGYDLNGDGFGDVPHRPVSLSSILIENINASFVLVYSPFFFLLDSIEKALPSFGPENLFDKSPRLTPTWGPL